LQFRSLGSLSQTSCMCFSLTVKITRTLVLQVEILESRTKCITEYKVSLCPVAEAPAMDEAAEDCLVETLGSDETTAFFPSLSPNTEYKLEVLGLDHDNQFSYSSGPLMVRTAPGELVLSKIALGELALSRREPGELILRMRAPGELILNRTAPGEFVIRRIVSTKLSSSSLQ
jgi:hypothetical protein